MSEIKKAPISELFNLKGIPSTVTMTVFPEGNPYIPTQNSNYVFNKDVVRSIRAFLISPNDDALYITGPTGSGKTSAVMEMCARLNWPVQSITAHGQMEMADLIGHHALVGGSEGESPTMQFQYGPLPRAMKLGHVLLVNEIDLIDPAELSGLNDVLEGRPLVITSNGGEVVKPHPMFRVIVTGNSAGQGDATGLYQGVQSQNIAAMDRYRFMEVNYPPKEVEAEIIKKVAPAIPDVLRLKMVDVANKIRQLFIGDDNSAETELSVTMSTRTLVRWAKLTQQYHGADNPILLALESALLLRTSKVEQEAILRISKDILGIE